jgi:hypothetical protein
MRSAKGFAMNTIMVQVADKRWTMQAMHLACAIARNTHAKVVLLHLLPVNNVLLLGSSPLMEPTTPEEREAIKDYKSVAADYGVELELMPFQYDSLVDALVQAADDMDASVVFAHLPEGGFQLWNRFQAWSLQQQLQSRKRQLHTIVEPTRPGGRVPAVRLNPVK